MRKRPWLEGRRPDSRRCTRGHSAVWLLLHHTFCLSKLYSRFLLQLSSAFTYTRPRLPKETKSRYGRGDDMQAHWPAQIGREMHWYRSPSTPLQLLLWCFGIA